MGATEQFADLKFKAECNDMLLTKAGGRPCVVRGPGEIWQDEEGALQFKIFAAQGYHDLRAYMERPGVIGQLIPDEDFFTLEAQEYILPRWTASRILPSPRGGPVHGLAHGYINELGQTQVVPANPESNYVVIRFKEKLAFPCNQGTQTEIRVGGQLRRTETSHNVAFVEDGDYRFEVRHESEHTVISLQLPAGRITPATPSRIHEALQFVLGRQLAVMVIETNSAGRRITRLTSPRRGHGKIQPPLQLEHFGQDENVWRMFTAYFRHVHANADLTWHPISRHVGSAIESAAASLEAEVLALAVAVEGLVGECFPNLAPVSADFLRELDAIQPALQPLQLTAATRNRVTGSLGAMRSPRNSDVLRAFIANHHLDRGLYNSWSSLRNASAHGGGGAGRDIEAILQLKSEVLSLLYSIVLAATGYTGPRSDYSIQGWPVSPWPVPQAPAPPANP